MDEIKKLVVVALDGYSASSRKITLKDVIGKQFRRICLNNKINYDKLIFRYEKSRFSSSKKRKVIKFLKNYNNQDTILLLIGKSYGAKSLEKIVNSFKMKFYKTYMVTIDPCWPKFFDWTPNCNDDSLFIKSGNVSEIFNIYLLMDSDKQCGSPVYSLYKDTRVTNYKIPVKYSIKNSKSAKYNHYNIIESNIVAYMVHKYIQNCMKEGGIIE